MTDILTAENGQLVRHGAAPVNGSTDWSDSNQPWVLKNGETVNDNLPSGVAIVNYSDYSQGGTLSFTATLDVISTAQSTTPYYVRLPAGSFHITDFHYAGYIGYCQTQVNKTWCGFIGAGPDQTFIVLDANAMSAQLVSDVSNAVHSPVWAYALQFGKGTYNNTPIFISGITFRGNFQQVGTLSGLSGTAPMPYSGLHIDTAPAGSRIQFCRFQGFGFAAKNLPPYELGAIETLHTVDLTISRVEIDGRQAPEINSAQPRSSGGHMSNYEGAVTWESFWLHHTRQSGWAIHDHAPSEGGNANDHSTFTSTDVKIESVSLQQDSWATDGWTFFASNVEEAKDTFIWTRPNLSADNATKAHICLATSSGNALASSLTITDPTIGNTDYNGCLVIGMFKTTNGTNPYWTDWNTNHTVTPLTITNNGVTLTAVDSLSFNAATHHPTSNYIVRII